MDMLVPSIKMLVNDLSMLKRAQMFSPAAPQEGALQAVCSTEKRKSGQIQPRLGGIRFIRSLPSHMTGAPSRHME